MLLNMDGFDDNTTSVFYGANSWGTAFTTGSTSAFSPSSSGSVVRNPAGPNLQSTDQTSTATASDPCRSLLSTRPLARSREDIPWQMYLSPSLSDSLHSLDLDINPVDLVYPQHRDPMASFAEFETLESPRSSGYQGTQSVVNDNVQQMIRTTPLVVPQPMVIQPALLSLISSTQDHTENSLPSAQSESSTKADEHTTTVYPSSILDSGGVLSTPQFDTYLAQAAPSSTSSLLSSSRRGRDPTITKLINHSNTTSTRPRRRGLSGWGTTNHLEPPIVPYSSTSTTMTTMIQQKAPSTSSSKSINSGLTVPDDSISPSLCSTTSAATGGSSRNSERLLKRIRRQSSDESLPPTIPKRAAKTRRIVVTDVNTEDESVVDNEDDDSDDYKPSRSPSLNPSQRSISPSSHSFMFKSENLGSAAASSTSVINLNRRKKPSNRKGKGKAKGSAALALAVVSQMVRNPSAALAATGGRNAGDIDLGTSTTRLAATGITRRKNQPIPLPIPVPNLNKKSRGRKVPHVINNNDIDSTVMKRKSSSSSKVYVKQEEDVENDNDEDSDSGDEEFEDRSSTRSRRKKTSTPEMSKTPSGESRTFVCVVPGCGKCFVRSEHLKRHVRSIHTHDKRQFLSLFALAV